MGKIISKRKVDKARKLKQGWIYRGNRVWSRTISDINELKSKGYETKILQFESIRLK